MKAAECIWLWEPTRPSLLTQCCCLSLMDYSRHPPFSSTHTMHQHSRKPKEPCTHILKASFMGARYDTFENARLLFSASRSRRASECIYMWRCEKLICNAENNHGAYFIYISRRFSSIYFARLSMLTKAPAAHRFLPLRLDECVAEWGLKIKLLLPAATSDANFARIHLTLRCWIKRPSARILEELKTRRSAGAY